MNKETSQEPSSGDPAAASGKNPRNVSFRKRAVLASLAGLVLAPLVALAVTDLYGRFREAVFEPVPFDVVAAPDDECPNGHWYFPAGFDTRTLPGFDQLDSRWSYQHGGYSVRQGITTLTLRGTSEKAVVLNSMRVKVTERSIPHAGVVVSKCPIRQKEAVNTRRFEINLDDPKPVAAPREKEKIPDRPPESVTLQFPYRISASEPEFFEIWSFAKDCACSWNVELDWTAGKESGTVFIDSGSAPFRTAGVADSEWLYYQPDGSLKKDP